MGPEAIRNTFVVLRKQKMLSDIPGSFWQHFARCQPDSVVLIRLAAVDKTLLGYLKHMLPPKVVGPWEDQLRYLQLVTNAHAVFSHIHTSDFKGKSMFAYLHPQEAYKCPVLPGPVVRHRRLKTVRVHLRSAEGLYDLMARNGLQQAYPTKSLLLVDLPIVGLCKNCPAEGRRFPSRRALSTLVMQLDDILAVHNTMPPHPMGAGSAKLVSWTVSHLGNSRDLGAAVEIPENETAKFDVTVDARWQPSEHMSGVLRELLAAIAVCCEHCQVDTSLLRGQFKVMRGFDPVL